MNIHHSTRRFTTRFSLNIIIKLSSYTPIHIRWPLPVARL